jgi:hypothetical protein
MLTREETQRKSRLDCVRAVVGEEAGGEGDRGSEIAESTTGDNTTTTIDRRLDAH